MFFVSNPTFSILFQSNLTLRFIPFHIYRPADKNIYNVGVARSQCCRIDFLATEYAMQSTCLIPMGRFGFISYRVNSAGFPGLLTNILIIITSKPADFELSSNMHI